MAHEIYTNGQGVASMAYVGDAPWHRLGQRLEPGTPIETWIERAGFAWSVERAPVEYTAQIDATTRGRIKAPGYIVLYRSDTKAPLGVVSDRYKPVQPRDVIEFFRSLCEKQGFELETAGVLKGGARYWALAKTGQAARINGDELKAYTVLYTSADGSLATGCQLTSVRVVCNNTLSFAAARAGGANGETIHKTRHSTQFQPEQVKRAMGLIDYEKSWIEFAESADELASRKVSNREVVEYFAELCDDSTTIVNPTPAAPIALGDIRGTSAANLARDLDSFKREVEEAIAAEKAKRAAEPAGPVKVKDPSRTFRRMMETYEHGQGQDNVRGSAWGLVNAVTRHVDHDRPARSDDTRLDSAWFGPGETLKRKAWDKALALVA